VIRWHYPLGAIIIKADVEGAECFVLRGFDCTIRRHMRIISVENSDCGNVTNLLSAAGNDAYIPAADLKAWIPFSGQQTNNIFIRHDRRA
jgi:hypothetical protein